MRNVSIQEFEEHTADLIAEVEAGNRLTLVRSGKAVVDIVPASTDSFTAESSMESENEARADLLAFLDKGADLGGRPFTYEERNGR